MPTTPYRSLHPLSLMTRELDRLLGLDGRSRSPRARDFGVPVNLFETTDGYRLAALVPGVSPDALNVTIDGRLVTLEVRRPVVEREGRKVHAERGLGDVTRRFELRRDVDAEGVTARYEHGVLSVTLPFAAGPRRIEIQQA